MIDYCIVELEREETYKENEFSDTTVTQALVKGVIHDVGITKNGEPNPGIEKYDEVLLAGKLNAIPIPHEGEEELVLVRITDIKVNLSKE